MEEIINRVQIFINQGAAAQAKTEALAALA